MKISLRILLINFIIIVLIFSSTTFLIYSLTKKLISLQHSKALLNSTSDFVFNYQSILQGIDDDFIKLKSISDFERPVNLNDTSIDFLFKTNEDKESFNKYYFIKQQITLEIVGYTIESFLNRNPNTIVKSYKLKNGRVIYYGRLLSKEFLENLSRRTRAEIALVINYVPYEISNPAENEKYFVNIMKAARNLVSKNNFDISIEELDQADFYATNYHSSDLFLGNPKVSFIIFSKLPEASELRSNINSLLIIICFAGVALSLILVLLFTGKIRKQIVNLSETAEKIRGGDIKQRVEIKSKDELGELGGAFNKMIDELERKESVLNEYSEFIALINQNPTLTEISDVALTKIIKSIEFSAGRLSLVVDRRVKTISNYGLQKELIKDEENIDLYQRVIEKGEIVELHFDENSPKLNSGMLSLDIKYILIYPIQYSRNVIAILELASISRPKEGVLEYLNNIKEQLAIGLSNALAFSQLENLVNELKKLNEEYQKQNKQISEQNIKLLELHEQLKEKASELELQKEKAVESSVLKSQFLANMSHELKTPLNSILGLSELILNNRDITKDNKEKLTVVVRNGNRLMNLINDILDYSKTEAGKMEIEPEEFILKDFLDELQQQVSPLVNDKNLRYVIHNDVNPTYVFGADKKKISQILLNLLSNAVKFTEKGIILLKCKLIEDHDLQFEVVDSGIGISNENLKIIFEEFRQIDGTSTRKFSGTGLGLAISKKYAEILGGELVCESEINKGSVFRLKIPVKILQIKKENKEFSIDKEKAKGTVLIIDNQQEARLFFAEYLASKNYEVTFASTQEEVLNITDVNLPKIIVLNLLVNDNGILLLSKIRSNKKLENIPLVTYAILPETNYGFGFTAFDYFCVPISTEKLYDSIIKYEKLSGQKIDKIVVLDKESFEARQLKEKFTGHNIDFSFLEIGSNTVNEIPGMNADMILANFSELISSRYNLINSLKNNYSTRNIPISLIISSQFTKESVENLNSNIKKIVNSFKYFQMDILKVIKDRLNLEEGYNAEDISSIWIESNAETQRSNSVTSETENRKKDFTILIVDDDSDTLYTIGEMVKITGCEITYAKNGIECLSVLRTMRPNLILLDIMMPLMDGFETIKRIRAEQNYKDIPVFALTAKIMLSDKDIVIRNGFNDLIPKPVVASELIKKIEKLIES
jgi:signal transduction histidine kinase/DNA-binding response OmpR family regulator